MVSYVLFSFIFQLVFYTFSFVNALPKCEEVNLFNSKNKRFSCFDDIKSNYDGLMIDAFFSEVTMQFDILKFYKFYCPDFHTKCVCTCKDASDITYDCSNLYETGCPLEPKPSSVCIRYQSNKKISDQCNAKQCCNVNILKSVQREDSFRAINLNYLKTNYNLRVTVKEVGNPIIEDYFTTASNIERILIGEDILLNITLPNKPVEYDQWFYYDHYDENVIYVAENLNEIDERNFTKYGWLAVDGNSGNFKSINQTDIMPYISVNMSESECNEKITEAVGFDFTGEQCSNPLEIIVNTNKFKNVLQANVRENFVFMKIKDATFKIAAKLLSNDSKSLRFKAIIEASPELNILYIHILGSNKVNYFCELGFPDDSDNDIFTLDLHSVVRFPYIENRTLSKQYSERQWLCLWTNKKESKICHFADLRRSLPSISEKPDSSLISASTLIPCLVVIILVIIVFRRRIGKALNGKKCLTCFSCLTPKPAKRVEQIVQDTSFQEEESPSRKHTLIDATHEESPSHKNTLIDATHEESTSRKITLIDETHVSSPLLVNEFTNKGMATSEESPSRKNTLIHATHEESPSREITLVDEVHGRKIAQYLRDKIKLQEWVKFSRELKFTEAEIENCRRSRNTMDAMDDIENLFIDIFSKYRGKRATLSRDVVINAFKSIQRKDLIEEILKIINTRETLSLISTQ